MKKEVTKLTVQRLLIQLGVLPKTNGYKYLVSAIWSELIARPESIPMEKLQMHIGKLYGVSATSVERCMRYSIFVAYNATKLAGINTLYNMQIITALPKLSDFITYIVEYLDCFYQSDDISIG